MEAVQKTPEREAFYKKIDGENLSALWNVLGDLVTPEPRSACRPHLWKFDSIRDYIAFPKNNSGRDTMIDSPSPIHQEQLDELQIALRTEVKA